MSMNIYLDEKHQDQIVSAFEELCSDVAESVRDLRNYWEQAGGDVANAACEGLGNVLRPLASAAVQLDYESRGLHQTISDAVREGVQGR